MDQFWLYFKLGLEHVLDMQAYDHVLFIVALCAAYALSSWKRMLLLVTVFTLGHSVSLLLSNFDVVQVAARWIEFLIPISIIATAIYNIARAGAVASEAKKTLLYLITLFFGLIHGFGFARYYNQINDEREIAPLLEFALGIETAQVIIVLGVLLLGFALKTMVRVSQRDWILVVSALVLGMTLPMLIENWPFGA